MIKTAKSIAGIEMTIQVLNPAEPDKKKWLIQTRSGKKLKMNSDGKTFNCPEHGQAFNVID